MVYTSSRRLVWLALAGTALILCAIGLRIHHAKPPMRASVAKWEWLGPWQWRTKWEPVAPSMRFASLTRRTSAGTMRITSVRADLKRWSIQVAAPYRDATEPVLTARQLCPATGAMINAGFFDDNHKPIGLVIVNGKVIQDPYHGTCGFGEWAVFSAQNGEPTITPLRTRFSTRATEAIQSAPIVLRAGQIPQIADHIRARRAAIGVDASGNIVLAVVDGSITLREWAICLRDNLHCRDALNLDGGPSAQLAFRGESGRGLSDGVDVPVFLQLVPR
jgi:uncharacterized protein YigE (DUF2233 family)